MCRFKQKKKKAHGLETENKCLKCPFHLLIAKARYPGYSNGRYMTSGKLPKLTLFSYDTALTSTHNLLQRCWTLNLSLPRTARCPSTPRINLINWETIHLEKLRNVILWQMFWCAFSYSAYKLPMLSSWVDDKVERKVTAFKGRSVQRHMTHIFKYYVLT